MQRVSLHRHRVAFCGVSSLVSRTAGRGVPRHVLGSSGCALWVVQSRRYEPDAGWQLLYYPILHELSDKKFFGRAHCGHEQVDVELRNPFLPELNAIRWPFPDPSRFLVSLPILARWHTSEDFPAEEMLRESGKFDFSEPQFFPMFHKKVQRVNYFHAFSPNRNTNSKGSGEIRTIFLLDIREMRNNKRHSRLKVPTTGSL